MEQHGTPVLPLTLRIELLVFLFCFRILQYHIGIHIFIYFFLVNRRFRLF